jgi:hypothetical protein
MSPVSNLPEQSGQHMPSTVLPFVQYLAHRLLRHVILVFIHRHIWHLSSGDSHCDSSSYSLPASSLQPAVIKWCRSDIVKIKGTWKYLNVYIFWEDSLKYMYLQVSNTFLEIRSVFLTLSLKYPQYSTLSLKYPQFSKSFLKIPPVLLRVSSKYPHFCI